MKIDVGNVDFLSTIYVQSFGDNYHRHDLEPSSDLEKACRRIRRRYKRYTDYTEALSLYNEYMCQLAEMHGGWEIFKLKLKGGLVRDFIPPKPRMKSTIRNKMIQKHGIVLSEINFNNFDADDVVDYSDELRDFDMDVLDIEAVKGDKKLDKVIEESGKFNFNSSNKTKNLKDINNLDFLEEYFKSKVVKEKKKEEEQLENVTLTKLMSPDWYKDNDTTEDDEVIFYKGRYLTKESADELQMFENLSELGWNSLKLMKNKSGNKRISRILKEEAKHEKKKSKKKKKIKNNDSFMDVVIGDNYDSFEQFEEEMLNMNRNSIFNY